MFVNLKGLFAFIDQNLLCFCVLEIDATSLSSKIFHISLNERSDLSNA